MASKKTEVKKATTPEKNEDERTHLSFISTVHGENYKTFLTEKYRNRKKWVKPDIKKIFSVIPGTIIKVYVEEGQKVKEGDIIMVLEAMKMKTKVVFPINGVVKKIYVSENERIPKGHLMIELE